LLGLSVILLGRQPEAVEVQYQVQRTLMRPNTSQEPLKGERYEPNVPSQLKSLRLMGVTNKKQPYNFLCEMIIRKDAGPDHDKAPG
jgi:hypothetical protein